MTRPSARLSATCDSPQVLCDLQAAFPQFDITRETRGAEFRYVARRIRPGVHPHTIVTADPDELHTLLSQPGNHPPET